MARNAQARISQETIDIMAGVPGAGLTGRTQHDLDIIDMLVNWEAEGLGAQVGKAQPDLDIIDMLVNWGTDTSTAVLSDAIATLPEMGNNGRHTAQRAEEMQRRRIGAQGQEIIDKPTYNKLTRRFLKNGGIIIRGEDAARHLKGVGAYASYITGANIAFIRDDATVSDVLEEMYHALQDRRNMYGDVITEEVVTKREIDTQRYLLSVAERYKIPKEQAEITRRNLRLYEEHFAELRGKKE